MIHGFAQLTWRENLRDIEACLNAKPETLYHLGFTKPIARTTLAEANEGRDWQLWRDLAMGLVSKARRLDFARLAHVASVGAFFVTRAKGNLRVTRHRSRPVDFAEGVCSDQVGKLTIPKSRTSFPWPLRKIRFFDEETRREAAFRLVVGSNRYPAFSIRSAQEISICPIAASCKRPIHPPASIWRCSVPE